MKINNNTAQSSTNLFITAISTIGFSSYNSSAKTFSAKLLGRDLCLVFCAENIKESCGNF